MKKHQKTVFALGMAAMMGIAGCESKSAKAERLAKIEKERAAAIEREYAEAKHQEDSLTTVIYDSLMKVPNTCNGQSAYQARKICSEFMYGLGKGTQHELDSITHLDQANVLNEQVRQSAIPILHKGLQEIVASLEIYDLGINLSRLNSYYLEPFGFELSDTARGDYEAKWRTDDFVDNLLENTRINEYGEARQQEIRNVAKKGYLKMMSELKQNRIKIAKDFAVYYPALDLSKIPQQYKYLVADMDPAIRKGEGDVSYKYELLGSCITIAKSVSVYDSKLKPEFFNTPGAAYKLVRISKGKWQVVKTLKNGKVEKSHVFDDNVEYGTSVNIWSDGTDVVQGQVKLEAVPGTNVGVHVNMKEYVYVQKAKKSGNIPGDPKRIEELQCEQDKVFTICNIVDEYSERAWVKARAMAQKRLSHNVLTRGNARGDCR